jgi:hypothetical protein
LLGKTFTRLVIGTSRTVSSAKKFVRITSGFGGGEFTKTLRKVCTCQKLKFAFLLLEYCKIRECYAVVNAFTIRNMYSFHWIWYCFDNYFTYFVPVFKYCYSDSRSLWTVMRAGGLALKNLIQPTISLEMPVPSQGHNGFHSLPVVDWFCLFI